jgi:hypothetical protein
MSIFLSIPVGEIVYEFEITDNAILDSDVVAYHKTKPHITIPLPHPWQRFLDKLLDEQELYYTLRKARDHEQIY